MRTISEDTLPTRKKNLTTNWNYRCSKTDFMKDK